jgi:hypothetical protein
MLVSLFGTFLEIPASLKSPAYLASISTCAMSQTDLLAPPAKQASKPDRERKRKPFDRQSKARQSASMTLEQAQSLYHDLQDQLAKQRREFSWHFRVRFHFYRVIRRVSKSVFYRWGLVALLAILGAVLLGTSIITLPFFLTNLLEIVAWACVIAVIGTVLLGIGIVCVWPTDNRLRAYKRLKDEYRTKQTTIERLNHKLTKLQAQWQALESAGKSSAHDCKLPQTNRESEAARARQDELLQIAWGKLRGLEFAVALTEVFSSLSYRVETDGVTIKQGVHFIAVGEDRRIAIQARGDKEKISQATVQEVFTGMAFYDCQSCLVITNGTFTEEACKLAEKVGCRLISEKDMEALVMGRIV